MGLIKRLIEAEKGAIAIMGALSLSAVLAMSSLAVEMGQAYSLKVQRQRVADLAALGAALAYKSNPTQAVLTATAQDIARANGLAATTTTAVLSADSSKVTVTIASSMPLALARAITTDLTVPITNVAVVSLTTTTTPGCVMAMNASPTNGFVATGAAKLQAPGCAVKANAGVSLESSSTTITASEAAMGKTLTGSTSWITTAPTTGNVKQSQSTPAVDPLASDARLSAAFAKLGQFTQPFAPTAPAVLTAPTVPAGSDWTIKDGVSPPPGVTRSGSSWTVAPGTYKIRSLDVDWGMTLTFQGSSTVTITNGIVKVGNGTNFGNCTCTINGSVSNAYQPLTFGPGTRIFGGAVSLTAGATIGAGDTTFVGALSIAGDMTLGAGAHKFSSISMSYGNLTLGAGDFTVAGPLTLSSGSITVGNGNSWIGQSAAGVGVSLGGGAKLLLGNGDLTVAGSVQLDGGGTTLQVGTGNVYIGRSTTGVGLSAATGITMTTAGGTYFSVLGPLVVGQGTVTLGAADYRIGNDGTSACTTMPSSTCTAISVGAGALTFRAGPFSANGNVTMSGAGQISFGATTTHYINGTLKTDGSGPAAFGAGLYVINGAFTRPGSSSGTMVGSSVTFILKDAITNDGGSSMTLSAPTGDAGGGIDAGGGLTDILFATKSTAATHISNGTQIYTGVIYAPSSDLTISNTSISRNGKCLMYIVGTMKLDSSGGTEASSCTSVAGTSSGSSSIGLVQ